VQGGKKVVGGKQTEQSGLAGGGRGVIKKTRYREGKERGGAMGGGKGMRGCVVRQSRPYAGRNRLTFPTRRKTRNVAQGRMVPRLFTRARDVNKVEGVHVTEEKG